jgi:hypothetical protein
MSKYDPPIIGSIITAARAVAIVAGVFCLVETVLGRLGLYRIRRDIEELNVLAWVALSLGVTVGGMNFIYHDLAGIATSETPVGQMSVVFIWAMFGLGFITRAAGRAAQPCNVFAIGSLIFLATCITSILTGFP